MIVTLDDQASKSPLDTKRPASESPSQVDPEEPPPSYSSQTESTASASSSPTFKSKATNYLSLYNKHDSIRGEFIIDPSISIPSSLLPPLTTGESEADRKNLCLTSKDGSVHAEVWLLPGSEEGIISKPKRQRTTIALTSNHGSISAQVQTPPGKTNVTTPFFLTAQAANGTVRLSLPRPFHGLLCLSTQHGSISVSDLLLQNATQLSQVDNVRRYFIGDFTALGEGEWEGDQIEVDAPHGSIRLRYIDEAGAGGTSQGKKGLLSRLFGR